MVVRGVVIMLDITEMKKLLKASLPHKRFKHSLAVYDTALELAAVYGLDKEKVGVGALLHDCGREIPTRDLLMHTIALGLPMDDVERNQPILLHAKLGVYYARENTALPIRKFWMLSVSYYWCGKHEQDGDGCLSG